MTTTRAELRPTNDDQLLRDLRDLRAHVVREADALMTRWQPALRRPAFLPSAVNLAQYIARRRRDLRPIQDALAPLGLSSLGRCEARVLANLDAVIASLGALLGDDAHAGISRPQPASFYRGSLSLRQNAEAVFGPAPGRRHVRIMVTMPGDAARDHAFVRDLVARGVDVVRINTAHDDEWTAIAAATRNAAHESGRNSKVMIDLEGPRPRTGRIAGQSEDVRVRVGDHVRLVGGTTERAPDPPQVECPLPDAIGQLETGQRVTIDEGRISLEVESVSSDDALLRVVRVGSKGRPFVQTVGDVAHLQEELRRRQPTRSHAIAAKIETALAVRRLPEIIVQGVGAQPLAVMIARGNLAVEIGFSRLPEIQEEILWLCEAAHVPVIWATQVLDSFVRTGTQSRAEMTDAAMAERAECVMLNKGPYVADAIAILDNVFGRMKAHQSKKTSRLRALRAW